MVIFLSRSTILVFELNHCLCHQLVRHRLSRELVVLVVLVLENVLGKVFLVIFPTYREITLVLQLGLRVELAPLFDSEKGIF